MIKAKVRIRVADLIIVLVGRTTHQAPGVIKEVAIAWALKLGLFRSLAIRMETRRVPNAGRLYHWTRDNLQKILR